VREIQNESDSTGWEVVLSHSKVSMERGEVRRGRRYFGPKFDRLKAEWAGWPGSVWDPPQESSPSHTKVITLHTLHTRLQPILNFLKSNMYKTFLMGK
jgi:hypothetical protein